MKKISGFHEKYYNSDVNTYSLKGGTKILHIIKPGSSESHISLMYRAGSYFDLSQGYPEGTSHLLEHVSLGPNKFLKTIEELGDFHDGDRDRAEIFDNGDVNPWMHRILLHGHFSSFDRQVERLRYALDLPRENIKKHLKKHKEIVSAEINSKEKRSRSASQSYIGFMTSHISDYLNPWNLGTEDSLKEIDVNTLTKFRSELLTQQNLILAIQSPKELSKEQWKSVQDLVKYVPSGKAPTPAVENASNEYGFDHFYQNDDQGVTLVLSILNKRKKKYDYRGSAIDTVLQSLINRVLFDKVREEMGLVYSIENYSHRVTFNHDVNNTVLACDKKNLLKTINVLDELLNTEIPKIINSEKGHKYIENTISSTIFPPTVKYKIERASSKASAIILGKDKPYNHDLFLKEISTVTPEEVAERFKESLEKPVRVWTKSPYKAKEIKEIIEKSKLHARWKESKAVPV